MRLLLREQQISLGGTFLPHLLQLTNLMCYPIMGGKILKPRGGTGGRA